jgi:uncharacterized protein YbaR (Trm112 family)
MEVKKMQYILNCPLCNQSLAIDAETDDEAMEKFMKEAKAHVVELHPNLASAPEEMLKGMVQAGMKKKETE